MAPAYIAAMPGPGPLPLLIATLLAAPAAHAQLLSLEWDGNGQFHLEQTVAVNNYLEFCGPLTRDSRIEWQFDATQGLDFNIHIHRGRRVLFPERRDDVSSSSGVLNVRADQEYCWMWTNPGGSPVRLNLTLRRR